MNVEATQVGFYVKLRQPGERFEVTEKRFSPKWMKRIAVAPAEVPAAAPEAIPVPAPEVKPVETPVEPPAEPIVKKRRGRKPKVVSE